VSYLAKVPPLRAQDVEELDTLRLLDLPSLSYTFLGWNALAPRAYLEDRGARGCTAGSECDEGEQDIRRLRREHPHPLLAEATVRRALSLAIDRTDLVDGPWNAYAHPVSSPIVSALWAHDSETSPAFAPQEAQRILDAAGWRDNDGDGVRERDGLEMRIGVIVNAENRVRRDVLERVAASLGRIGVQLVPEPLPRQEFVARARDKNFDAVLSGWWAGTRVQPQNLLHTRSAVRRGNNLVSWSTPESDSLLDRASAATSREAALPLWIDWQRLFLDEQPLAILYEERTLVGLSTAVHGPDPFYLDPYHNIHRWWVAPDNP
jgi:peptide/nickel transport system substrate-binding protein